MTRRNLLPIFATALFVSAAFASTTEPTSSAQDVGVFADQVAGAKAAQAAGRTDDAITMYERAVRKARRDGADPASVARVHNRLGMLYQSEGRFEDAEAAYTGALRSARSVQDTAFMATMMNNLGSLYIDMNQYNKAERRFKAALRLDAEQPSDVFVRASILNNMGRLAQLTGRADEANAHYNEAFVRGRTNQKIAALNNLATLQREQNELDRAAATIAQAHLMSETAYGDSHSVTLQLQNNRAIIELERGAFEQAEALARSLVENSQDNPQKAIFERTQEIVQQETGRVAGRLDRISVLRSSR